MNTAANASAGMPGPLSDTMTVMASLPVRSATAGGVPYRTALSTSFPNARHRPTGRPAYGRWSGPE